jgi:hypothetical protein
MKNIFTTNLHLSKRTIHFTIICIFISLFFNSCKKSDIIEEEIKPVAPKCLITKIAFPNSQYFADFQYNSSGQLISMNNQLESSEFYLFEYDVKGNCIGMKTYTGTPSNPKRIMDEFKMKYDDKNILTEFITNNSTTYYVKMNDKKQVIEVSGKDPFVEKTQFEYNLKGGLIKRTIFDRANPLEISSVVMYEYDDKISPFNPFPFVVKNHLFSNWGLGGSNITLVKEMQKGLSSNSFIVRKVSYEYNADGFPTVYKDLDKGFSLVFSYKCQ